MRRRPQKRPQYPMRVAVLVRYKVAGENLGDFIEESFGRILPILKKAHGFRRLLVMGDAINPVFVDVLTEWEGEEAFLHFARRRRKQVWPSTPHEILEKCVYHTYEIVD